MSFAKNNFSKNRWSVELQDLTEPATGLVILQNHSKAKMSPWYLLFKLLIKNITYSNLANMYQHRYTFYGWIPTLVCVGKDSGKKTEKVWSFAKPLSVSPGLVFFSKKKLTHNFTGPRCLWGPVYGSRCLYDSKTFD